MKKNKNNTVANLQTKDTQQNELGMNFDAEGKFKSINFNILGCVHIKRALKIIASWITEMKIISNLS